MTEIEKSNPLQNYTVEFAAIHQELRTMLGLENPSRNNPAGLRQTLDAIDGRLTMFPWEYSSREVVGDTFAAIKSYLALPVSTGEITGIGINFPILGEAASWRVPNDKAEVLCAHLSGTMFDTYLFHRNPDWIIKFDHHGQVGFINQV